MKIARGKYKDSQAHSKRHNSGRKCLAARSCQGGARALSKWLVPAFAAAGAVALAVAIFVALPAQATSGDELSSYPIMNLSEPDGFSTTDNPLGTDTDTPVLLVEETELLRVASWDNNRDSGSSTLSIYDTLTEYSGSVEDGAENTTNYNLRTSKPGLYDLSNVQAVSFDPAGTGRRDHVAFVGLDSSKNVKVVVYDATNNIWSSKLDLGSMDRFPTNGTNYYAMDGALSITAGDYNNDNKDTLVVYAVTNGSCSYLHEIRVNASKYSISLDQIQTTSAFINPMYADTGLASGTDKCGRDILRGEVRTGDFNGDNIDDIAVLTQVGKSNKYDGNKYNYKLYAPYLSTACGASGVSSILSQTAVESSISSYQRTNSQNYQYFDTLYCASMAIGDFEGAGYDTIGIVGRELTIRDNAGNNLSDDWEFGDYLSTAKVYASATGGHTMCLTTGSSAQLSLNKLSKKAADTNSNDSASLGASAVRFDGVGTMAYLVVDGAIYSWADSGAPVQLKNFANDGNWGDYGSRSFVNSQAVGNFTAGEEGYEQLVFTIAEKNSSTQDDYHFRTVMIYASAHDETTGEATEFACTTSPERFIDDRGDNYNEALKGLVVAVDNDDDGVIVKYESKEYYYTDPEILAVLQAAPYFDELYKNDAANLQNGGTTTLTLSEYHGTAYGESDSRELEAGMNLQIGGNAYPATGNVKFGYHGKWESGWEESMSYQVEETFSASTTDQVIVYRTPVFCYNYKVYNRTTGQYDDRASYTVKQRPTYVQMSVADYERFVSDYNSTMAQKKIEWEAANPGETISYASLYSVADLSMLGNEGNPYAYTSGGTTYGSAMSLGAAGGSSGINYEITNEQSEYSEHTDGTYIGADIMSNIKISPVNIGGQGQITFDFSSTSTTVRGKSVEFSGAVGNLVQTTFFARGYDLETYDSYHYDWQFCIFNTTIPSQTIAVGTECYDTVQVLGYRAYNVEASPALPEITSTKLVTGGEQDYFDLKWEATAGQEDRPAAAKYYLYLGDEASGTLVAELDGSQTSYQFTEFESGKQEYAFRVVAEDSQGNRSIKSDPAYGYTSGGTSLVKAVYKGVVKSATDTRYEYEIRYNDGSTYPFYLISAGSQGVDRSREAFSKLQSEGLIPDKIVDWNEWTATIDDIHNLNGCLDSGEASYTWELDECSEIRTTTCALCGNILVERHELHAHDFTETVVAGSCTSQGYTAYKCKNCGFEKHDNWTGYRHDCQEVEVPATCSSTGYTMQVCATCGEYHITQKDTTPVDPTAHCYYEAEPVLKLVDSDGDGKTDGHVHVACSVCKYCGEVKYGEEVEVDHELVESYVKSTGTMGETLYTKTEFCRLCDYSKALEDSKTKKEMFGSSGFWTEVADKYTSDFNINTLGFTEKFTSQSWFTEKTIWGSIGYVRCLGHLTFLGRDIADEPSYAVPTVYEDEGRWTLKPATGTFFIDSTEFDYTDMAWWLACEQCSGSDAVHAYLGAFYDMASEKDLHTCVLCGHTEELTTAHEHTYESIQVCESLAGAGGHVLKVCSGCGQSAITSEGYDPQTAVDTCDHNWIELEHSCTDSTHVRRICTCCGKTELVEKTQSEGEEVAHQYDTTVVEPTCTTAGYTLKKCVRCGAEEVTDEVPALGHTAAEGRDVVVDPTCEHEGYTTHVCTRCSEEYADSYTAQRPHEYDDAGLVTQAATCCSGEITLNHCIHCGKTIQVGSEGEIDEDAHDYDEELFEMTCTSKGCINYICRHCGHMYTVYLEDLPDSDVTEEENTPTGHVEDTSVTPTVVAPTATEPGYTLRHCANCGQDYQTDPTEPQEPVRESKTYNGVGAPSSSLGQDGDVYVDLQTSTIYIKSNGTWSVMGGTQEEPTVNIITSEGKYVYLEFGEGVPEADKQAIKNEISNIKVTGLSDNMRLEYQKKLLEITFPELWEKVPMDSFLTDETNTVTMRLQLSMSVESSNLSDPDEPFIEYTFVPKILMWVTSPAYGNYSAEHLLTKEDFELIDATITITAPICGDYDVTKIKHINAETGEVYQIFTEDGQAQFTYDKENNTVSLTIGHFSNIRIEGKRSQSASTVAKTGDAPYVMGAAAVGAIAALSIVMAAKRRARR